MLKLCLHGGIPRNVSSRLFVYSFNGEFAGNFQSSFYLFSGFYGGVGYQYTQFVNAKDFRDPFTTRLFVRLRSHAVSVRISKDYLVSRNACWVFNLHSGISYNTYANRKFPPQDTIVPLPEFITPFVQPQVMFEWKIDHELCFSVGMGCQYLFAKFNPVQSSLSRFYPNNDEFRKYNRNAFPMSWINFSFGCSVYIGKKRN